jgi:hypothetical protein
MNVCRSIKRFPFYTKSRIPPKAQLQNDDIVLMNFGFQLIRHVMFNEPSLPMKTDALDKRMARKKEREEVLDGIVQKLGPMEQLEPEDKYKHLD